MCVCVPFAAAVLLLYAWTTRVYWPPKPDCGEWGRMRRTKAIGRPNKTKQKKNETKRAHDNDIDNGDEEEEEEIKHKAIYIHGWGPYACIPPYYIFYAQLIDVRIFGRGLLRSPRYDYHMNLSQFALFGCSWSKIVDKTFGSIDPSAGQRQRARTSMKNKSYKNMHFEWITYISLQSRWLGKSFAAPSAILSSVVVDQFWAGVLDAGTLLQQSQRISSGTQAREYILLFLITFSLLSNTVLRCGCACRFYVGTASWVSEWQKQTTDMLWWR